MDKKLSLYTLAVLFSLTIASYPLWQAGFYSDDALNSNLNGLLTVYNESLLHFIYMHINYWLSAGRFFPVTITALYSLWFYCYDLTIYRVVHWVLLMVCLMVFSKFIYRITRQVKISLLFLVIIPLFWSVTSGSCGLTGFSPLLPLITLLITSSLFFFKGYLQDGKQKDYLLSIISYLLALLSYEASVTILCAITVLSLKYIRTFKRVISILSPFILLTFIYIIFTYAYSLQKYEGVKVGEFNLVWTTYLKQLFNTLPLTHYFFFIRTHFSLAHLYHKSLLLILAGILFCITSLLVYLLANLHLKRNEKVDCLAIGLSYLLIPPSLIALSAKYQQEIFFGSGHMLVFIQQMGLALVLIVLVAILADYFHNKLTVWKGFRIILGVIVGSIISFAFIINNFTVHQFNLQMKFPRLLFESSLKKGLLDGVANTSLIVTNQLNAWDSKPFIAQTTGVKIDVADIQGRYLYLRPLFKLTDQDKYFLDYATLSNRPTSGYVVLAHVHSVVSQSDKTGKQHFTFELENPQIFLKYKTKKELGTIIERLSANYKADFSQLNNLSVNRDKPHARSSYSRLIQLKMNYKVGLS